MKDNERDSSSGVREKVFPLDRWRLNKADGDGPGDENLNDLLNHMRGMRDAVPVNRNLQEELRKRLVMRGAEGSGQVQPAVSEQVAVRGAGRHSKFLPLLAALVLLVSAVAYWGLAGGVSKSLEVVGGPREVSRFWSGDFRAGIGLPGDKFLAVRNGNLVLMSLSGASFGIIKDVDGTTLLDVAVSPGGAEVAVAWTIPGGATEIVVYGADQLISSFQAGMLPAATPLNMWASEQTSGVDGLSWSPDGSKLAFTILEPGEPARVWVSGKGKSNQTFSMGLGQGQSPAWSPDGKSLVMQRTDPADGDTLWLVPLEGQPAYLGRGRSPAWSNGGYLIYLTTRVQEKVLSYTTDGLPRYTVHQPVDEVRWLHMGNMANYQVDGQDIMAASKLLLVPGQSGAGSGQELLWLRQLELAGSTEPQVLYLEQENYHHSLIITEDSQKLYLLRDTVSGSSDSVIVTLMEVLLGERRGSEVEIR